jgi:hypothetical protein
MTCQKDVKLEKHHILALPNLHVLKTLLSLKSKGFVKEDVQLAVAPLSLDGRGHHVPAAALALACVRGSRGAGVGGLGGGGDGLAALHAPGTHHPCRR